MTKKSKLKTPDWIIEGFDSEEEYNKSKGLGAKKKINGIFKIRRCAKCDSDDVGVVIGENGVWECHKCGWKGKDIKEEELQENEFLKLMEERK